MKIKLETDKILDWHWPKYLSDEQITKYFDNLAVMNGWEISIASGDDEASETIFYMKVRTDKELLDILDKSHMCRFNLGVISISAIWKQKIYLEITDNHPVLFNFSHGDKPLTFNKHYCNEKLFPTLTKYIKSLIDNLSVFKTDNNPFDFGEQKLSCKLKEISIEDLTSIQETCQFCESAYRFFDAKIVMKILKTYNWECSIEEVDLLDRIISNIYVDNQNEYIKTSSGYFFCAYHKDLHMLDDNDINE